MARHRFRFPRNLVRRILSFLLGSVVTLLLLEGALRVAYQGFVYFQTQRNQAAIAGGQDEVRILCVGESTTAVAGDEAGVMLVPRTSYPSQLETLLNTRQSAVRYRVLNNGIMGGTTGSVLERLDRTLPATRPHVIIAMMGIKDTPDEWVPLSEALPRWTDSLHTVRLASWLQESARLRKNANITEIRTFSDLPKRAQEKDFGAGNYIKELRILAIPAALDRVRAGVYLMHIGQLHAAETLLREVIAEHDVGYTLLSEVLAVLGRYPDAYGVLEGAFAAHPEEGMYRVHLADLHIRQREYAEAEAILDRAALEVGTMLEPDILRGHIGLQVAELHLAREEYEEALAVISQLVFVKDRRTRDVLPPLRLLAPATRGRAHIGKKDWIEAEKQLLLALDLNPSRHTNMWLLSQVYRQTGQFAKEEEIRWSLLESRGRVAEYFELAKLFRLSGHPERVPEVLSLAIERTPSLKQNYAALYATAKQNGIQLVVMQYPSFDLDSLHLYAPETDGVVFIDNLHVFDADPDGYFFEPTYPNSFSHYTVEGARVLADHVADTVLELRGPEGGR